MTRLLPHAASFVPSPGFALSVACLAALPSPDAASASARATNNELIVGTTQEFENLNLMLSSASATSYISQMVNRNFLVTLDENGKWIPVLAESIPTLENGLAKKITEGGKEKVQVIWKIRKNAIWADGKPIVAEDFKLAWDMVKSGKLAVGSSDIYTQVEKFEIDPKDPRTMVWTYEKSRWDFYQVPQFYAVPKHLEQEVWDKFGKEAGGYEKNTKYNTASLTTGLYSGPYRPAEIKLGSHVKLVPNEKWWGPKPKLKSILIKVIPNTATLEANLVSGNVHVANQLGLTFDQAIAFEKKVKSEKLPFKVVFADAFVTERIDLNLDNPFLADKKVRQALVHGIDRQGLVKALFEGRQKVAEQFFNPLDSWSTNDPKFIVKYDYSQRKARSLLEQAGLKKGADGVLTKDGKRFSIQFLTTAGNKARENVQAFIKQAYAPLGIEVVIKNEPARVFFGDTTQKRKFDAFAMFAMSSSPDSVPRSVLHSSSIPSEKNGWAGQNYAGLKNAALDKAIDDMEREWAPEKRKDLAKIINKIYSEELPQIPLYTRANIVVIPSNLQGMKVPAHQFDESLHVERWSLK